MQINKELYELKISLWIKRNASHWCRTPEFPWLLLPAKFRVTWQVHSCRSEIRLLAKFSYLNHISQWRLGEMSLSISSDPYKARYISKIHFGICDWKDISIGHVIIIIRSEVSTFPLFSYFPWLCAWDVCYIILYNGWLCIYGCQGSFYHGNGNILTLWWWLNDEKQLFGVSSALSKVICNRWSVLIT